MFSGGIGSWMTAKRIADQHGTENLTLLFADVKGNTDEEHVGEDADTYRFIGDAHRNIGGELVFVEDGRSIWEIFKDDRFLGNSRLANCSKYGKQIPCRKWLDTHCDPTETTVYVGIDWTETHRLPAIKSNYLPYAAEAPLTEPPFMDKQQMLQACTDAGVRPPRLYGKGYPHNNCGGFCVRAGHAQFRLLLSENPERYRFHERKEQELRDHLGKDVSILKDRAGGTAVPLTLKAFRERSETGQEELFDPFDFGGCGCFVDEVPA
jgi:hypothetical protein